MRSGDSPILPGSTLKGALRTAWLAARVTPQHKAERRADGQYVGKTGQVSNALQAAALEYDASRTEQDPMRDIAVADVTIAAGVTLIDKAQILNLKGEGPVARAQEVQLHLERLAALADRGAFEAPNLNVDIATLDNDAQNERSSRARDRAVGGARALPSHSPSFEELRSACNAHHVAVWFGEIERFYRGLPTEKLRESATDPHLHQDAEPSIHRLRRDRSLAGLYRRRGSRRSRRPA